MPHFFSRDSSNRFQKTYKKLSDILQKQVDAAVLRLMENPAHPGLNVHAIKESSVTDDYRAYPKATKGYAGHRSVCHSADEYARVDADGFHVHSNTVEGVFSLLKRGIYGIYHNVSRKHLHRYCTEFEFRYNTRDVVDGARVVQGIRGMEGKRLRLR